MTSLRLSRRISADPVSAALLLAGPSALELAPGLERTGDGDGGQVLVQATLPPDPAGGASDRSTVLAVRASAPRRTPTSYVAEFEVTGQRLATAIGRLVLTPEPGDGVEPAATVAELSLDYDEAGLRVPDQDDRPTTPRQIELLAEGFLAGFAAAAARRASAA